MQKQDSQNPFQAWQQSSRHKSLSAYVTRQAKEVFIRGKTLVIHAKKDEIRYEKFRTI